MCSHSAGVRSTILPDIGASSKNNLPAPAITIAPTSESDNGVFKCCGQCIQQVKIDRISGRSGPVQCPASIRRPPAPLIIYQSCLSRSSMRNQRYPRTPDLIFRIVDNNVNGQIGSGRYRQTAPSPPQRTAHPLHR